MFVDMLPPSEDLEDLPQLLEPVEDVLEEVEEAALMTVEPLTFNGWFNGALDLFFDTLSWVMSVPYFRFFATFCLFLVACNLCAYFVRSGRRLAR